MLNKNHNLELTKLDKLINIESDQELLQFAKKYHLKGDGTKDNPIRISKFIIKQPSSTQYNYFLINMLNTTLYVIIEDCIAENAQIYLSNCEHVFILNNYLHYTQFPAIELNDCQHCTIMHNTIISSTCINLARCSNNIVINNTCIITGKKNINNGITCLFAHHRNIICNNYILLQFTEPKIFHVIQLNTNLKDQLANVIMDNIIVYKNPSPELAEALKEEVFIYGIQLGDLNTILNNKIINIPYAFVCEDTSDIVAYNITYPIKSDRRMEYGVPKANFKYVYNVNANLSC